MAHLPSTLTQFTTNLMKISVIIPVHNERSTIAQTIKAVRNAAIFESELELIVVDDASSDGSREVLESLSSEIDHLVLLPLNKGKGHALSKGLEYVTGKVVIFQDADLEYDPRDYVRLTQPILEGFADAVYGSRFVGSQPHRVMYYWHYQANRFLTLLVNILANLNLTDMETGMKAFDTRVWQKIKIEESDFGVEPEITLKLAAAKLRLYEVGASYYGRTYDDGKKIGPWDAWRAIWVIFYWSAVLKLKSILEIGRGLRSWSL